LRNGDIPFAPVVRGFAIAFEAEQKSGIADTRHRVVAKALTRSDSLQ
jgi:hypothetical protein